MDADHRSPQPSSIDEARRRVEQLEEQLAHARTHLEFLVTATARASASGDGHADIRRDPDGLDGPDVTAPPSGSDPTPREAPSSRPSPQPPPPPAPPRVTHASPPEEKLALFRERFAGRKDCYAVRWENRRKGTKGWKPAVRGGFYTDRTTDADLLPLTDRVIWDHLSSPGTLDASFHAGLYPLRADDTCKLLVCDFDDEGWKEAAAAYARACREAGLEPLAEISRSGDGAHVWLFLEAFMPAWKVRAVGMRLLRRAMATCSKLAMSSYDRFFPAQDSLPVRSTGRMRLGNLIALPMEGESRTGHTTVFADPDTWEEFADQFAALSAVRPAGVSDISRLCAHEGDARPGGRRGLHGGGGGAPGAGRSGGVERPGDLALAGEWGLAMEGPRRRRTRREVRAGKVDSRPLTMTRDSVVHVPLEGVPTSVISDLTHMATLWNPEYFLRQRQRMSTFGFPRTVVCFERDENELRLPRGVQDAAVDLLTDSGFEVTVKNRMRRRPRLPVTFTGQPRAEQKRAVVDLTRHDCGVLVAPTGSGKTVMACAIIARRHTPTAILVPTKELAEQWRERLVEFLDVEPADIGQVGGGKRRRTGRIDIVLMGSVNRRTQDPSFLEEYGLLVIDECHKVGSPSLDAALRGLAVRRWVGLTATPYRSDELNGLITLQCGPIRHTLEASEGARARPRRAVVHTTGFTTDEGGADFASQQQIFSELVENAERNTLIAGLVAQEARQGRSILVLTRRIEHVEILRRGIAEAMEGGSSPAQRVADALPGMEGGAGAGAGASEVPVLALSGQLPPAERAAVRERLTGLDDARAPFVLVAIDRIAGEGLDLPSLDTEFLAMPTRFKGRVVQFVGRVTRDLAPGSEGEERGSAVVHDFHDAQVPWLHHMYLARRRALRQEGFELVERH